MKAGDGILAELARQAGVRPSHIFHLFHYRKQMGERFSAAGFAEFARLEQRHVDSMVAVLDQIPQPIAKQRKGLSRLTEGWSIPEEWLLWAQTEKGWSRDVTETVGHRFRDYWIGNGKAHADWLATWRNWVRSPYSPQSVVRAVGEVKREWGEAERQAYLERLKT